MASPVPVSAAIVGADLTITFDQSLDPAAVPSLTQFNVNVNGSAVTVTAVAVPGDPTCLVTISPAAAFGDSVVVQYTKV